MRIAVDYLLLHQRGQLAEICGKSTYSHKQISMLLRVLLCVEQDVIIYTVELYLITASLKEYAEEINHFILIFTAHLSL